MYNSSITLNAASYNNLFGQGGMGRLYVPVSPGLVKYAQLSYVHGTPAKTGQKTVPLDKIHILNTLISQLVSMKKESLVQKQDITELTDTQKDALIKTYQEQIHAALVASQQPQSYGMSGLIPETGTLVNISA